MYGRDLRRTAYRDAKLLHRAIQDGSADKLLEVISLVEDINCVYQRNTPLFECLKNNNLKLAKILIRAGANIDLMDSRGSTIICDSVRFKNIEFLKMLIENCGDVNVKDRHGFSPLHIAANIEGGELFIKCLLDSGADIDSTVTKKLDTPLHYAIKSGSTDKVKLFLMNKLNPKKSIYSDVIYNACKSSHEPIRKIVDDLISYGFSIPMRSKNDLFFLEFAIETHSKKLLEHFLQMNKDSRTIYLSTFHVVHEKKVKDNSILNIVLDYRLKVRNGSCHIHDAVMFDQADRVVDLFLRQRSTWPISLLVYFAVTHSSIRVLESLLECKQPRFNVNSRYGDNTLTHLAAELNNWKAIEVLWKFGANMNSQNEHGQSPLHLACIGGKMQAIQKLLQFGADVNLLNHAGYTPPELMRNLLNTPFIQRHILGLELAKFFLLDNNVIFDYDYGLITELDDEVKALKQTRIPGTSVSFFQLLRSSEAELNVFSRNESVVAVVHSESFKYKFKHFSPFIIRNIETGMRRNEFCELFAQQRLFPRRLPYLCLEKILSFLSNEDLRIITGSYDQCEQIPDPTLEIAKIMNELKLLGI